MKENHYQGEKTNDYEDPCLTCKNNNKEDCCCKEWEEKRLNSVFEEDFT